jgi:hypothetical protein
MEHGVRYALHYVHYFCRFNMEVNMSQTDVDAAQYTRSISYAQAEGDKEKVLELHKRSCEMAFPNTTSNMRSRGKILR